MKTVVKQRYQFNPAMTGKAVALMLLAGLSPLALAAGFESDATNIVTQIRTAIYAIVGVCAGLALLWCFAMGWSGRKTWTDVLELGLWIV
uniref:TrbC/VirB2 family protein n=1 Tax=Snodgrassella sp. CFCC 13594 TaxID=1775559 RepID=UPI000836CDD3